MSVESAREYLKNYRLLQAKITRLEQLMSECPEKRAKYKRELDSAVLLRDKIEDSIDALDGGILSEILSQKYICGRSLEQIGYLINYSKRQTERLHIKALLSFKPIQ